MNEMERAREYLTEDKIYHLALRELRRIWSNEKEIVERHPGSRISQERENMAYMRCKALQEIAAEKGLEI